MKENIVALLVLPILFAIVSAEIGELSAQSNDSQNLEQILQRLDRLDKAKRLSDWIGTALAAVLGGLVVIFIVSVNVVRRLGRLGAEVEKLSVRIRKVEQNVTALWVVVILIAACAIACTLDLIARHT